MNRRAFLQLSLAASVPGQAEAVSFGFGKKPAASRVPDFDWDEVSIPELQGLMQRRKITSVELTADYLARIQKLDRSGPNLNAIIETNPEAMAIARALDKERRESGPRSPMHGIPVVLKDNIDTHDRMMTTAGSLALVGAKPARDAFLVERLREAGAVILAKANLSEWANFRSNRSTSGWSARGGLARNPYALDRNTSGSSSGSAAAVSANLCAVAVGTETDGSIISPSCYCGIVGLKPTVGLISRSGIIPISHTQDTSGPMGRTVTDVAILLAAMAGVDPLDEATAGQEPEKDYVVELKPDALRGARIGVARQYFRTRNERAARVLESAIETIKKCGAEVIDPIDVPSFGKMGDAEFQVLLYEFKDGLNRYLRKLGPEAPIKSLEELIAFNDEHAETELRYFGQETLIRSQSKGPLTEKEYLDALEKCERLSRKEGIDAVMDRHNLDAIVAPSGGPAHRTDLLFGDRDTGGSSSLAAVARYPGITLPAGFVSGLPVGISFFGRAWSEGKLLKLAYAFEQAAGARQKPKFLPSIDQSELSA